MDECIAPPFLTAPLDGGEWLASRPGLFNFGKEPPVPIVYEAGWSPVGLVVVEKRKISCSCRESNPCRLARSPSLFPVLGLLRRLTDITKKESFHLFKGLSRLPFPFGWHFKIPSPLVLPTRFFPLSSVLFYEFCYLWSCNAIIISFAVWKGHPAVVLMKRVPAVSFIFVSLESNYGLKFWLIIPRRHILLIITIINLNTIL
jgi:hypothetical protein